MSRTLFSNRCEKMYLSKKYSVWLKYLKKNYYFATKYWHSVFLWLRELESLYVRKNFNLIKYGERISYETLFGKYTWLGKQIWSSSWELSLSTGFKKSYEWRKEVWKGFKIRDRKRSVFFNLIKATKCFRLYLKSGTKIGEDRFFHVMPPTWYFIYVPFKLIRVRVDNCRVPT